MKDFFRNFASRIPGVRFWIARWIFLHRPNQFRFWGVFKSHAKAKAHIPARLDCGVANPNIAKNNIYEDVPESDTEVVRILSALMPEIKNIFDLGGSVGVSFYRYRAQISYPAALRWLVCDVPPVNETGRRIAQQRGETQLAFTDSPQDALGADVYLTCGALQYFEEPFADLLAKLKEKPAHVLVNRIPLTHADTFFTLQHGRYTIVPYQIANMDGFVASVEALGYDLVETWKNNRFCNILLRPDRFVPHYYGFYFKKRGG